MVSDVMGHCQQWDLHCSVYFYKRAHEYPVLDRRPGSNDLELDFRWVCAVSWFSHIRLRKPTRRLVLDRSIRDGNLERGIHVLLCESKQSDATLIVDIVPLCLWSWRHNENAIFPATSKLRLAVIAVELHSWTSSFKHTREFGYEKYMTVK